MEDELKAAMLAEIEDYSRLELRQPGDVSLLEITQTIGMGKKAAKTRADAMVASGKWTMHEVFDARHHLTIWRRA